MCNFCDTLLINVLFFGFRKKDGVAIKSVNSVVGRVSENRKDGVATLVIQHSTEDDAGNYTCVALVKQTEITNATVRVACKYFKFGKFYNKSHSL